MERKDFKIGKPFYTGSGKWICIDIGLKSVVATKHEEALQFLSEFNPFFDPITDDIVAQCDIVPSSIFWEMDWGGCRLVDSFKKRNDNA